MFALRPTIQNCIEMLFVLFSIISVILSLILRLLPYFLRLKKREQDFLVLVLE